MAFLRRSRKLLFFSVVGIFSLVIVYFADVLYLHNSSLEKESLSSKLVDASYETNLGRKSSTNSAEICERSTIKANVDIQTEELWLDLFGQRRSTVSPTEWTSSQQIGATVAQEEKLKVFVVPHSHVDPGWLQTVADYQNATNNMLYNMISYMPDHPNMTFTWMEISFFEGWWTGLTDQEKKITKDLIASGRFQMTSGSWVMTDEATPYYWASIDNIVEGQQFLKRELDVTPKVMWSNDPFGYGPTVPYLFRLAGIERAVIQRVHSSIKANFARWKSLDFLYRQFFDSAGQHDTQVHLLPYQHYDIPNSCGPNSGVCCLFDFKRITNWGCGGMYAVPITDENLVKKANDLYEQYRGLSRIYRHNVVLTMLGDDFRYDDITEWSQQHDNYVKLMEYMNNQPDWNIEVHFGTFDQFFAAFNQRAAKKGAGVALPSLSGDFFPYNDVGDDYWTGYYTTRPFYKRQDRAVQAMIRAADISSSLVYFSGSDSNDSMAWFEKMRISHRNLALFQHHDAITGTSKWKVAADYGKRLNVALLNSASVAGAAVSKLIGGDESLLDWTMDMPKFNGTPLNKLISVNLGEKVGLWVFNPLPHTRSELVRFRVAAEGCLSVLNAQGVSIPAQLNPVFHAAGVESKLEFELLFEAKLPPLAAVSYTLFQSKGSKPTCAQYPSIFVGGPNAGKLIFPKPFNVKPMPASKGIEALQLEGADVVTYHNAQTGLLERLETRGDGIGNDSVAWKGSIQFWHYPNTRSGAYLFEPSSDAVRWPYNVTAVVVVRGSVTEEIHSFTHCVHHKEYLRKFSTVPEPAAQLLIENTVDIRPLDHTELVMRILNSDIVPPSGSFLTDSMGFQLMPRRYLEKRPVNENYYPMASQLILQTDERRSILLSGQPHGSTSPSPGGMEVMLDRKLTMDDSKGLGYDSLIRDNVPVTLYFRLAVESGDFTDSRVLSMRSQRSLQNLLYTPVTFRQTKAPDEKQRLAQFAPVQDDFSCDTLLLNIRPLEGKPLSVGNKKKHLLLLHRTLSDCRTTSDLLCHKGTDKDLYSLLTQLLKNPRARECTLSGIENEKSLDDLTSSQPTLKPMEIKSICIY